MGAAGLITKYKKRPRPRRFAGQPQQPAPQLTRAQKRFNAVHEATRNRVENVVRKVKGHRLFSGRVFKGKFETLNAALTIIGHVAAYQLRQEQRFQTFGPWPHAYSAAGVPNPP